MDTSDIISQVRMATPVLAAKMHKKEFEPPISTDKREYFTAKSIKSTKPEMNS